jgi:hypothetical protein
MEATASEDLVVPEGLYQVFFAIGKVQLEGF